MPSNGTTRSCSRRQVLAALGSTAAAGTAGCTGRLPGTGARTVDVETTVEADRVLWEYPERDDEPHGIGYGEVAVERRDRPNRGPVLHLKFNSTVGGSAASEPYREFVPDWFRFSVRPPYSYRDRLAHHLLVEPPGSWESFRTYYDLRGGVRESFVELRSVDTQGTVQVPAVFEPSHDALPDRLRCSFAVQASRPGALGETVRADGTGTIRLGDE